MYVSKEIYVSEIDLVLKFVLRSGTQIYILFHYMSMHNMFLVILYVLIILRDFFFISNMHN